VLSHVADAHTALLEIEAGERGFVITADESFLEPWKSGKAHLETAVEEIKKLTVDNPEQQHRLELLAPAMQNLLTITASVIDLRRGATPESATELVKTGKVKSAVDEMRHTLLDMQAEEDGLLRKRDTESDETATKAEWVVTIGTLLALTLGLVAAVLITRDISGPLQKLTAVAEQITAGDLAARVVANGRDDEVGQLTRMFDRMIQSLAAMAGTAEQIATRDLRAKIQPQSSRDVLATSFARMSENLREQISSLVESANVLGTAASEIVASTTQLASGATESATAVSQTTATVEEVRQTAQLANQKAKIVSENAQKAAQMSQAGRKYTEELAGGMSRIRQQMEAIAESMVRLSEQGQAIALIIATVEDLAAQSNLLAVNAAIEAAKAGEHGKGFGVVAQEVKSLAEQSRQATTQVRNILGEIQKATTAAVMTTEQGMKAVEAGGKQTESAGQSIASLNVNITEAAQAATQIAASSQQQLVGMDQVAIAMENIKQVSTQNVASARQLENSARNLNEVGQRMKQMVERYKM
jgi:methyl-accepting chemotaxis protein